MTAAADQPRSLNDCLMKIVPHLTDLTWLKYVCVSCTTNFPSSLLLRNIFERQSSSRRSWRHSFRYQIQMTQIVIYFVSSVLMEQYVYCSFWMQSLWITSIYVSVTERVKGVLYVDNRLTNIPDESTLWMSTKPADTFFCKQALIWNPCAKTIRC